MKSINLFRILPSGVVSKKDIGPLMIRNSIVLCNFLAASRVYTEKRIVATWKKKIMFRTVECRKITTDLP